jgi:hypothetical protein
VGVELLKTGGLAFAEKIYKKGIMKNATDTVLETASPAVPDASVVTG